ncbi:MAG: hypothetical protein WBV93_14005 [Anaerobacillus sp.]
MGKLYKVGIILLFTALLVLGVPGITEAATSIQVKTEIGIDGKAQIGKGFPVEITLQNNGESVKGDLIISSSKGYSSGHNQVIPVELQADEKKTLDVSVGGFGEHIQQSSSPSVKPQHIAFYEGGYEQGDKVKLTGDLDLTPSFLPYDRLIIGVLSNQQDAFNAIKLAKINGSSPEIFQLSSVYESSEAMEVFDMLLINDYNVANFSEKEQTAISEWVKKGGKLVVGTSPGVEQRLGNLASMLPMKPTTQKELNQFELLSTKKPLKLSDFNVSTGELSDNADIIYKQDDTPLVLKENFGMGKVIQLAYDPASKELVEWDKNGVLWENLIHNNVNKGSYGYESFDEMLSQLTYNTELFPSSTFSISLLSLLFVLYLVVVVPVLYFILKKKDKREWGWWIIPSLALLTSVGIYMTGAKDRLEGSQSNEAMIYKVAENGRASGFGATSILTNGSGDYSVSFTGDDLSVSPKENFNGDVDYQQLPFKEETSDGERITFQNVEYWSTRSAMIQTPDVEMGLLKADLSISKNKLSGTISNKMDMDLTNMYLLSGANAYSLGQLGAGDEMNVSVDGVQNSVMGSPTSNAAQKAFPHAQNSNNTTSKNWKEFSLLDFLLMNNLLDQKDSMPVLIGYTTNSIINSEINGKEPKRNSLNLIALPVGVTTSKDGAFAIGGDDLLPEVESLEGGEPVYMDPIQNGENWIDLGAGVYEFTYELPQSLREGNVNYSDMTIRFDSLNTDSEIYLMKKDKKEVKLEKESQTFTKNISNYIDSGKIVIQVEQSSNYNREFVIPRVSLKGEFAGD